MSFFKILYLLITNNLRVRAYFYVLICQLSLAALYVISKSFFLFLDDAFKVT